MLVNKDVIEELCIDAGESRTEKAKKYADLNKVSHTSIT